MGVQVRYANIVPRRGGCSCVACVLYVVVIVSRTKRGERTSLWKDVSRLRLALPESAQQYLGAYRKMAAFTDVTGDGP